MYNRNNDNGRWTRRNDTLSKESFDALKQDFDSVKMFSKCLSGSTYVNIDEFSNIYMPLNYKDDKTYYISDTYSSFAQPYYVENGTEVNADFYKKYFKKYGNTLKNTFSPTDLVKTYNNIVKVQYTTSLYDVYDESEYDNFIVTKQINTDIDTGLTYDEVYVDGFKLVKGDKVLLRTQMDYMNLMVTENPLDYLKNENYFTQIVETETDDSIVTSLLVTYYNNNNGVYEYDGKRLNRVELDIDDLFIYVENGIKNFDTTYTIGVNTDGYSPYPTEPVHLYKKVDKYALRHKVDYNNAYDINFIDVTYTPQHSIFIDGLEHVIPERTIAIGEFGNIIINQNNISVSVNNRNKVNLNSISSTNGYYWICGDEATILKVNKLTLEIEYIETNDFRNYKSIDFIDDLRGIVVGDLNAIYSTIDGGETWTNISISDYGFENYNKVVYNTFSEVYISGKRGIFFKLTSDLNKWVYTKKYISKVVNDELSILLECNVTDFVINNDKILLISENNDIITYDIINDLFTYIDVKFKFNELNSVTYHLNNTILLSDSDKVYIIDLNNYTTELDDTNIITGDEYVPVVLYNGFVNNIKYYNTIFIVGNNSIFGKVDNINQPVFVDMDADFNNRIASKMLFLDYDIASKLNFFTDDGTYRLPSSFTHTGTINSLLFNSNEPNWIDFYSDSLGIFEYYSNINNSKIEINKSFRKATSDIMVFNPVISIDKTYCLNYFPTIVDNKYNIYFNDGTLPGILPQNDSVNLVLFNNLVAIKVPNTFDVKIGDVLEFKSSNVETNIVVNKIVDNNSSKFVYAYTYFNNNIINNLYKSSINYNQSNTLTIKNLNIFVDNANFVTNFNNHILGLSYNMSLVDNGIHLDALFSNVSSYYNLDTNVNINTNSVYSMAYEDSYSKFGFETKYNIKTFLQNITPLFDDNMEFNILPKYYSIPTGSSNSTIRLESSPTNKLILGKELGNIFESVLINTFVDIQYNDSYIDERLLVTDKVYDSINDEYIIMFNNKLNYDNSVNFINILSRNALFQISEDLQLLNNIYRPKFNKNIIGGHKYDTFEKQLKNRFFTDSYARALLSHTLIKEYLTAIVYIDDNYSLSMNVVNIETSTDNDILVIANYNEDGTLPGPSNKYSLTFSNPHNLKVNEYVIVDSNLKVDKNIDGLHIVDYVISPTVLVLKTNYVPVPGVTTMSGKSKIVNRDLFFSYIPVDMSKISIDKSIDIPIELYIRNYTFGNKGFQLSNVDMKNYRYTLVDNMTNDEIHNNYHWILEAEVSKAIIGKDSDGLVWYDGTWRCGRWFGGKWMCGKWISGDFYDGVWNSRKSVYKLSHVDTSNIDTDEYSFWYNGRWYNGTFNGGRWYNGRWYDGTFNNGRFINGIWNNGIWNNGEFNGGVWVDGIWNNGIFNMDVHQSYWINGTFNGGDFENGRWMNGVFNKLPNSVSRFGTKSTSSKQAIWDSGTFNGGEVHSYLTLLNGQPTSSEVYRNTIFKTCNWNSGNFYGGVIYNIDFKSGDFYGGIVDNIQIRAIHIREAIYDEIYDAVEIKLDLNGVFHFNDNNTIHLLSNRYSTDQVLDTTYELDILGTYDNIKSYRILETNIINNDYTEVILRTDLLLSSFNNIAGSSTTEYGYEKSFYDKRALEIGDKIITTSLVSKFKNANIHNCTWYNGIFEEGNFIGGIWYDGCFNGNWGK